MMSKKKPRAAPSCPSCGSPQTKRWGPELKPRGWDAAKIVFGNWIGLERCALCQALWFVAVSAGHSSPRYRVRWPHSVQDWIWLESLDSGQSLRAWHDDQFLCALSGKPSVRVDLDLLLRQRQGEPG